MAFTRTITFSVLTILLAAPLMPTTAVGTSPCDDGADPVYFLGVVYDSARRYDFQLDVDNFELYLSALRDVYCIPDDQAEILAFYWNYQRNGVTYEEASEANVKASLERFGAAASADEDALFFFFLSSHGLMYAARACPGVGDLPTSLRAYGSFSALRGGNGENGYLYDCELGRALNDNFDADTRMAVFVDCSFCGGFSDSLTAVSGTLPDGAHPVPSGVVAPNRIVFTGCAITTECFGGSAGGVSYGHMSAILQSGVSAMDGWTTPGFPTVQGVNVPVPTGDQNGIGTVSEWVFAAQQRAYDHRDIIGTQQQFRLKYGFDTLDEDIRIQ